MPLFSRNRKGRDISNNSLTLPSPVTEDEPQFIAPEPEPSREEKEEDGDPWVRTEVEAEEVQELLHVCTAEMKSRALDMPLLLLPFRPFFTDINAARMFIRKFFQLSADARIRYHGRNLYYDLKLVEPMVLCSIMKWCWSRLRGGVVTRNTYELFRIGEQKSNMAKNAFDTFIPLSVNSEARKRIIFDFFDLLAAIAANSKNNGLGGRKLSRLAGWWAFSHAEDGKDFHECYRFWARSADATSHLFFAYLRSRAPELKVNGGISQLPRSLQALLAETEYPPRTPLPLQSPTSIVVMLVESMSSSPFGMLRRAKGLDYGGESFALQSVSCQDNLINALTPECRRVLECISSNSQAAAPEVDIVSGKKLDPSWSQFEDLGFTSLLDGTASVEPEADPRLDQRSEHRNASDPRGPHQLGQKTPASWAEFLQSGFADDATERDPATLAFPPEQILPPLGSSTTDNLLNLEPADLRGVNRADLDETFWWVWMTSLSVEEPANRKSVFGRCAFVETDIVGHRWLVFEERKRELPPPPPEPEKEEEVEEVELPVVVEKKNKFGFGKRTKERRVASGKALEPVTILPREEEVIVQPEKEINTGPDRAQQEKVQAAAALLVKQKQDHEKVKELMRRGRTDENADSRTASLVTLQPVIARDAGPALQWARKFDKEVIRARYLGDAYAGRGQLRELSPNSNNSPQIHTYRAIHSTKTDRELPPLPMRSTTSLGLEGPQQPRAASPLHVEKHRHQAGTARPKTPPVNAEATPMTHRSEISTSLIPSPLMPRRKPISGSFDHAVKPQEEEKLDLSTNQYSTRNSEDPFSLKAEGDATEAVTEEQDVEATSPTGGSPTLKRSKHGSVRGLRKLFGKRAASEPTKTLAAKRAVFESSSSTQPPQQSQPAPKLGRKRSFLRRGKDKTTVTPPLAPSSPTLSPVDDSPAFQRISSEHERLRTSTRANLDDIQGGEPGPVITEQSSEFFDVPRANGSATFPNDMDPISPTFSNFTQGVPEVDHQHKRLTWSRNPMDDIPNYIGEYQHQPRHSSIPEDQPAPRNRRPSSPPHFKTRAAALLFAADGLPEPGPIMMHDQMPLESKMENYPGLTEDEGSSSNVTPEPKVTAMGNNRWAQIRQNAHQRRVSEDQAIGRKTSSSRANGTDEGETSGEESIEARVARIKARVAELTGTSSQPGPSFQASRHAQA